ncbi:competence protein ComEC [Dyadobacter jejuensis]|uniref:Competence protein ComEC n=1 Tax=Dyadobacter jejuensis TaxID=1082580 RepID=A0A316AN55_9BACT|nr:ComEC/Rec2 family competence protein [Dyadobacter jejuensis]PWJ58972.1 competence protein ComEC [Dyadobacter jejuensis]
MGFVLCYGIGLLLGEYYSLSWNIVYLIGGLLACIVLVLLIYNSRDRLFPGLLCGTALCVVGVMNSVRVDLNYRNSVQHSGLGLTEFYTAMVIALPQKRTNSIQIPCELRQIYYAQGWHSFRQKIIISLPADQGQVPKPGQLVVVRGKPEIPRAPLNPFQFNYAQFLKNKGIYFTDYIRGPSLVVIDIPYHRGLKHWALEVSSWTDLTLRTNLQDDRSYGLLKAMLLGRRDDLRSDQIRDYTVSGAVHILSVSGLHVGILYLFLSALLGWIKRWRWGHFIYLVLMLLVLGFYAVLTGLPDSVVRATLMFSIFLLAQVFQRKQASVNSLAIAALLLLIWDPRALHHVGFQLSFLAMLGILLFYNPLYRLWGPENAVVRFIWQVTCLSVAAQLGTFPLSVFYFHQFPVYFWLINPFVILLTEFLLQSTLGLLFFEVFHLEVLSGIAGFWVGWSAFLTNLLVSMPKHLPGYLLEGLHFDIVEVLLLYSVLLLLWLASSSGHRHYLGWAGAVLVLATVYSSLLSVERFKLQEVVVFYSPGHDILAYKRGNRLRVFKTNEDGSDTLFLKNLLNNYVVEMNIDEVIYLKLDDSTEIRKLGQGGLIFWNGKTIYLGPYLSTIDGVDLAIITKIPNVHLLVFPDSNTLYVLGGQIRGEKRRKSAEALRRVHYYELAEGALRF